MSDTCPDCGHQTMTIMTCYSWDIKCFDESGHEVLCLCPNGFHFGRPAPSSSTDPAQIEADKGTP